MPSVITCFPDDPEEVDADVEGAWVGTNDEAPVGRRGRSDASV